ncbi:MAG: ATP-binding protein [Sedimenticola sp.]
MKRLGIRGRLFLAFGVVATLTVAATIVGWISFARLGEGLESIVGQNVPAVTAAARLAEKGGTVIGLVPALSAAENDQERARAWSLLMQNLDEMHQELDKKHLDGNMRELLADLLLGLISNLHDLDENVRRRLWLRAHKEALLERLRWASADFIDEVEPLIDDTRFNINLALRRESDRKLLESEMSRQQALFRLNAAGALLAELAGRAANLPDRGTLHATTLYFREIKGRLNADLQRIDQVPGVLSLNQSLRDILAFADGEKSLFQLRTDELQAQALASTLLARNRDYVSQLNQLITDRVAGENRAALVAAAQSRESIAQGKVLTAGAALGSLLAVVLVVWLYVGRSLVGRLIRLGVSMRAIAQGDLKADIPVYGADEIGDMADSLRTFRDTLRETQYELVQAAKLAALGQLIAGISHEINQPLTAIMHYARNTGILAQKGKVEDAQNNLKKIYELTERAIRIINSLHSQARKPRGNLRPIDLKGVLDNVLVLYERRLREMDAIISMEINESCRYVQAGQVRLEQVVMNLVGNALDAMKESSRRLLEISSHGKEGMIELRVRDSGCGISADEIGKVFDPFYTTKEVGEGLGLGLSISYNIISGFGGTMRVDSQPGEGTTFRIHLKCVKGDSK